MREEGYCANIIPIIIFYIVFFCVTSVSIRSYEYLNVQKTYSDDRTAGFGGNFLFEKSRVSSHPAAVLSHHDAIEHDAEVGGPLTDVTRWEREKVKTFPAIAIPPVRFVAVQCGGLARQGAPCVFSRWSASVARGTAASTATRKSRETRRTHGEKPARHQVLHLFNVCTPRPYGRREPLSRALFARARRRRCRRATDFVSIIYYYCTFHASITFRFCSIPQLGLTRSLHLTRSISFSLSLCLSISLPSPHLHLPLHKARTHSHSTAVWRFFFCRHYWTPM